MFSPPSLFRSGQGRQLVRADPLPGWSVAFAYRNYSLPNASQPRDAKGSLRVRQNKKTLHCTESKLYGTTAGDRTEQDWINELSNERRSHFKVVLL